MSEIVPCWVNNRYKTKIYAFAADYNLYEFKGRKNYVYWHRKKLVYEFGTCKQICDSWTETLGPIKNDLFLWAACVVS